LSTPILSLKLKNRAVVFAKLAVSITCFAHGAPCYCDSAPPGELAVGLSNRDIPPSACLRELLSGDRHSRRLRTRVSSG
jgi:hypothetical protein